MTETDPRERWQSDLRPILVELDRLTAQVRALRLPLRPGEDAAAGDGLRPPDVHQVSVKYGRTVSDGNYGSERVSVGFTATVEPGEDPDEVFAELAGQAREVVVARLLESDSSFVRAAVAATEQRLRPSAGRSRVDETDGEEDDPERPF